MNDHRTPPNDQDAERAVLGILMHSRDVLATVAADVRAEEFYQPAHETICAAVLHLTEHGAPADPVSVNARLVETGDIGRCRNALIEATVDVPPATNVEHYLAIVKDRAQRRRLIDAAGHIAEEAYGSPDPAESIVGRAELRLSQATTHDADVATLMNLDEFLAQEFPLDDWVLPRLLSRGERLVITGPEGLGKTTLIRQLAVCAAAGMDPFGGKACDPVTVLAVDAENPNKIMVDRFGVLRKAVANHGYPVDPNRLWIERCPSGINLADAKDRLWLQRRVQIVQPDLLVIGPAYKLYVGGGNQREEDLARQVTATLDALRELVGCALILEHHAPHAAPGAKTRAVRPIGSSLWLRWPEFGIGIQRADHDRADLDRIVDVTHWRGPRDERPWPEQLESGGTNMPWVETVRERRF